MRAVVSLSGGLDSTTLLYYVRDLGYQAIAFSVDYGQRHKKELEYAHKTARKFSIPHFVIDASFLKDLLTRSALTGDIEVPEGHYAADNMKLTVVPNRNMIFASIAIGIANNIGASKVFLGVHSGDHAIYPDCRPDFISAINLAARIGNEGFVTNDFSVEAPFMFKTKTDIVTIGASLNVPFNETWSCYKGLEKHCGKCGTCVERIEAFELAKVDDPTEYQE